PAAAVEDRRLRVAGLEVRVVTAERAPFEESSGAQVAMVEVEGVPAGEDGLVVQQLPPRLVRAEQLERHPPLPGDHAEQDQPPESAVVQAAPRRSRDAAWRLAFHRRKMVAADRSSHKSD